MQLIGFKTKLKKIYSLIIKKSIICYRWIKKHKIFSSIIVLITTITPIYVIIFPPITFNNENSKFYAPVLQGENLSLTINENKKNIPIEDDFYFKIYKTDKGGYANKFIIELRPEERTWYPFYIGIPQKEQLEIKCETQFAPAGTIPFFSEGSSKQSASSNEDWFFNLGHKMANKENSYYIVCNSQPSILLFGQTETKEKNYCIKIIDNETAEKCKQNN